MSMNDVIDEIAIAVEQNPHLHNNILWLYSKVNGYNLLKPGEEKQAELSSERIYELNQEIRVRGSLSSPRLSIAEINAILSDYPYKLPVEFYELYQRGNGVLPIGLGDKDWNCYSNYFPFPNSDIVWQPLHESMETYKDILKGVNDGWYKVQPNIFPLMRFERWIWAIAGSETQQPTSPVFRFHGDDMFRENFTMKIVWNSLTAMIAGGCSWEETSS